MVVIRLAHTAPINLPGVSPTLSYSQAWAALARKARVPQDFVLVVESCEIHSETDQTITCTVAFKQDSAVAHAHTIREVCTLYPPCRLDYEMEDGSVATNIISVGAGSSGNEELLLTFFFSWEHPELLAGSDEARIAEIQHKTVAETAVQSTITTMRKLAREGTI